MRRAADEFALTEGAAATAQPVCNLDKLDDMVLAMLSLCMVLEASGTDQRIQAEPEFDYYALQRLYAKGYLAAPPSTVSGRPVWLTPEGARRARDLFRQTFIINGGSP